MSEAVLGALYEAHSDEFRTKLSNDVERIIFVDGGLVVRRQNGKWEIELESDEASSFIAGR